MFSVAELMVTAVVALVVIKPKDLPRVIKAIQPYYTTLRDTWTNLNQHLQDTLQLPASSTAQQNEMLEPNQQDGRQTPETDNHEPPEQTTLPPNHTTENTVSPPTTSHNGLNHSD